MPRFAHQWMSLFLLVTLGVAPVFAQSTSSASRPGKSQIPVAVVKSVKVVQDRGVPALEIVSTHPVVPSIQTLESPPRIVIDLPNVRLGMSQKAIPVQSEQITAVRIDQFQQDPPVTRIVLDLLATYGYTWDAAGNRLMIRLKPAGDESANKKPFQPPAVPTLSTEGTPAIVPVTSGPGTIVLAGSRIRAGASVSAGSDTAVLHLSRGGEIRVCPGTTVSVLSAKTTQDLTLGMGTGALETHYTLQTAAHSVMTPDFRILFTGPGEFDYAISADTHGNTCVRALVGNTSAATVSELMGDGIYQVKPTEQAFFHSGRVDTVDTNVPLECGCPPPPATLRASTPVESPESSLPENARLSTSGETSEVKGKGTGTATNSRSLPTSGPETAPLPASSSNGLHVQVDAPIVFKAESRIPAPPSTAEIATLPVASPEREIRLDAIVATPPPHSKPKHPSAPKRFAWRVKGIFKSIFR